MTKRSLGSAMMGKKEGNCGSHKQILCFNDEKNNKRNCSAVVHKHSNCVM